MRVLVAGITGQLGHGLVEAAGELGVELVPVTRAVGRLRASDRLARAFPLSTGLGEAALTGDVTLPQWGLTDRDVERLAPEVDAVLDVAAQTNWAARHQEMVRVNVLGAVHGLDLARSLHARHPRCGAYVYAGSVYAAGGLVGAIPESPFGPDRDRTAYEHTKWLAEHHLRSHAVAAHDGVACGIARVGGLMGNSVTGATAKQNSLYLLTESSPPFAVLPVTAAGRVDMLPRDVAGATILRVVAGVLRGASPGCVTVHVCAGRSAPTFRAVLIAQRQNDPGGRSRLPRILPMSQRFILRASTDLPRLLTLGVRQHNAIEGLRYIALDRVFERDRLAGYLPGPLPTVTAEQIAALVYPRVADDPMAPKPARVFARVS